MSELVALHPCLYSEEWVAYGPHVVEMACLAECGEEAMIDCWGPHGPEPGDRFQCGTAFVRISCDVPDVRPEYVEFENQDQGEGDRYGGGFNCNP